MEKGAGMWGQTEIEESAEAQDGQPKGLSTKAILVIGLVLVLMLVLLWNQLRR
jgi:hypothetical protein